MVVKLLMTLRNSINVMVHLEADLFVFFFFFSTKVVFRLPAVETCRRTLRMNIFDLGDGEYDGTCPATNP